MLYGAVGYNDKLITQGYQIGTIKEVSDVSENADGTYKVHLVGDEKEEIVVNEGDLIYQVVYSDYEWYRFNVGDEVIFSSVSPLIQKYTQSSVTIYGKEYSAVAGDVLFEVYLDNAGRYKILLPDGGIRTTDYLPNVATQLKDENGYRLQVTTEIDVDIASIKPVMCFSLPTDDIYFDYVNNTVVQNMSGDFWKIHIFSSNYHLNFIYLVVFAIFVFIFINKEKFTKISKKMFTGVLIFTVCNTLIGVALTYIMLGM